MKKIILITAVYLATFFSIGVSAEELKEPEILGEAEISASLLKISKDGTGIIKFKQCGECEVVLVKITLATKAYLNGTEMNLLQARKLSKPGFISVRYTLDKKEVRRISFSN